MAVGSACTVGERAKLNGYWYQCTATNVWSIVQPVCTECTKFTGGTLNNGGYTFVSVSPPNGAKIAGDYPSSGTRYCWVYNSTSNTWEKKTDADCGDNTAGGAWYGCTVTSCVAEGGTCTVVTECCDDDGSGAYLCEPLYGSATKKCITCPDCVDSWLWRFCATDGAYKCGNALKCIDNAWEIWGTCPPPY